MTKKIVITSESKIKVNSLIEVISENSRDYQVLPRKTKTWTKQPIGEVQTFALNLLRVAECTKYIATEDIDCIISIESGISCYDKWYDFASVIVFYHYEKYYELLSEKCYIPEDYSELLDYSEENGIGEKFTFGEVLCAKYPELNLDPKNWQEKICGLSRKQQIKDVLQSCCDRGFF